MVPMLQSPYAQVSGFFLTCVRFLLAFWQCDVSQEAVHFELIDYSQKQKQQQKVKKKTL